MSKIFVDKTILIQINFCYFLHIKFVKNIIYCVVEGGEDVHHIFPKAFYKEQREIEEIEKEKTKKHILLFQ